MTALMLTHRDVAGGTSSVVEKQKEGGDVCLYGNARGGLGSKHSQSSERTLPLCCGPRPGR